MEPFNHQILAHQRKALHVVLDALGVPHQSDEAGGAAPAPRLERPTSALAAEHRRLRQRIAELEHELEAVGDELDALDRAIDASIDAARERRLNGI